MIRTTIDHLRTPVYLNAYALIASNAISSVLGIVYWSVAARTYPVAELGVQSAVISMMLFISGIAQLNLRVALIRLLPESGDQTRRLLGISYGVAIAASFVIAVAVFGSASVVGTPWSDVEDLTSWSGVLLLVAGTMAWSIFNMQDGVLAAMRRTIWVPVENGLFSIAKIALLAVLAVTLPSLGIVVSWVVPAVAAVIIVSFIIVRWWLPAHVAASHHRSLSMSGRRLFGFVAADSIGAMFSLAPTTLLPVMVLGIAGPEAGAYFYIAWTIVSSLNIVPLNMAASMTVEAVHTGTPLGLEVRRLVVHMARIIVPLVVAIVLLAPFILAIFGSRYRDEATTTLQVAVLALLPFSANAVFIAACRVRGMGRVIVACQAFTSIVTLALSVVLLPSIGLVGVSIAWLAAQTALAVVIVPFGLWPLLRRVP